MRLLNEKGKCENIYRKQNRFMKTCETKSTSGVTSNSGLLKGLDIREPENQAISGDCAVQNCDTAADNQNRDALQWCYLYVPRYRVDVLKEKLKEHFEIFVHTHVKFFKKKASGVVQKKEVQTISGLVFVQGDAKEIQHCIDEAGLKCYLCKDCGTGKVARIPHSQMRTFMCVSKAHPDNVRFLLRPLHYYANNNTLLRITSGDFAGLEGYIVRIDRDRKLVMNIGGMTVAIGGVHKSVFEKVCADDACQEAMEHDAEQALRGLEFEEVGVEMTKRRLADNRGLDKRQVAIDRFFHPINSRRDADVQAENVELLLKRSVEDVNSGSVDTEWALQELMFVVEEMGFYYSTLFTRKSELFEPVKKVGAGVLQEIDRLLGMADAAEDWLHNAEAKKEKLLMDYGYMFDL